MIVKDDHDYIREWIDYHHKIGVEHFYISDNGSNPPLQAILQDYIAKGLVVYTYDRRQKPQCAVYNECIAKYREESKWIGFFDADEFFVLRKHSNIRDFLSNYEKFGALSVCWVMFGSNGHDQKQKSILRSYTTRANEHHQAHYKTIAQPARVKRYSIHNVEYHVSPHSQSTKTKKECQDQDQEDRRYHSFN